MRVETTREDVLKAHSESDSRGKRMLENLFPDVFEEVKVFCQVGDTFYIEGSNTANYYTTAVVGNKIKIFNLRRMSPWKTEVDLDIVNLFDISVKQMKELLKTSNRTIEDIRLLPDPREVQWKERYGKPIITMR